MRKLIFFALAATLLLSFSMPSAAVAKAPAPFSAAIWVAVVDGGVRVPAGAGWRTTDEVIRGQVIASDWADLNGAYITVNHSSHTLIDATGNIVEGNAHATFLIQHPAGLGAISGNYHSKIGGNFSGWPGTSFTDVGGWDLKKGEGVYAGVEAHGKWSAELSWGEVTLGGFTFATFNGLATLSGTHH